MADFSEEKRFAKNGDKRLPTINERDLGFPANGAADERLFNRLFHQIQSEVGNVAVEAGITQSDGRDTILAESIMALINSVTGSGNTSNFVLMDQARARLPIYPEILSADGKINISSPAAGTVRIPAGVQFMHRGIFQETTDETDFPTDASKIYHVRWGKADGYQMVDTESTIYNPDGRDEGDKSFDTTHDDMLMARVATNANNIATITNLINLNDLYTQNFIDGDDPVNQSGNSANWLIKHTMDWSRHPKNYTLNVVKSFAAGQQDDRDVNFVSGSSDRSSGIILSEADISVGRYGLDTIFVRDGSESVLVMNFNARA